MKHYLEQISEYSGAKTVICFNQVNLSRIEVYEYTDLYLIKYNNLDELKSEYQNYIKNLFFELSDKKTFDSAYIEFTKNLNELAKEL